MAETIQQMAARYRTALENIVNALGPKGICECGPDDQDTCGLRDEAAHALRVAKEALDRFEFPTKHGEKFLARRKWDTEYITFTVVHTEFASGGVLYLTPEMHTWHPDEVSEAFEDFRLPIPAAVPPRLDPSYLGIRIG